MLKHLARVSGIIIMFYIVINFYFFMFVAMTSNGVVTVYFNKLGEATFEYIMYILLLPLITLSFILEIKEYTNKRKEYRENKKNDRQRRIPTGDSKSSVRDTP